MGALRDGHWESSPIYSGAQWVVAVVEKYLDLSLCSGNPQGAIEGHFNSSDAPLVLVSNHRATHPTGLLDNAAGWPYTSPSGGST
jgi:hypothetical protein